LQKGQHSPSALMERIVSLNSCRAPCMPLGSNRRAVLSSSLPHLHAGRALPHAFRRCQVPQASAITARLLDLNLIHISDLSSRDTIDGREPLSAAADVVAWSYGSM